MSELIRETDPEEWANYHLLDPKEFHYITLPKELLIYWEYLPRECLPNGEGVVYFQGDDCICASTITRDDIDDFLGGYYLFTYKPLEQIRKPKKIICETEKEEWEQHCLHPDKLRPFLTPCDPRGDWYYTHLNKNLKMDIITYFKIGEQLYAEITAHNDLCPLVLKKWEWDENTQRMRACARYQLTNNQKDK